MIKKKKSFFNMVEVALAIAVAGIGIAGIMALFPVGMNASRDAMAENYCGDAAEQLMSFISAYCKASNTNWNTTVIANTALTETKNTAIDEGTASWCASNAAIEGSIYYIGTLGGNLQLFKIVRKSGDYEDFAAAVRLWKGQIKNVNFPTISPQDIPYAYGTALYAEVSWPMSKPYSARDKKYFYKEIFNPNP